VGERHSIRCPRCDDATDVVDSRSIKHNAVRRRRRCRACGERFTTYETMVDVPKCERLLTALTRTLRDLESLTSDATRFLATYGHALDAVPTDAPVVKRRGNGDLDGLLADRCPHCGATDQRARPTVD
jgi:hypothetical protein